MWINDLTPIFLRTDGRCHLCHCRLTFRHYAMPGVAGCWEIEHSVSRSRGSGDRLGDKYAACVTCTRSKSARSTRASRLQDAHTRASYSGGNNVAVRRENAELGAFLGGFGAALLLGSAAWLVGGVVGAIAGDSRRAR
jgi:hypothetical protein